jgi:site-specific recombinase XerD
MPSARSRSRPRNRRKPSRRLPAEVLTPGEVSALLAACGGEYTPIAKRHRALIALMYRAGLRVAEALALHPKDIDLERGAVRVLRGKGGFDRVVGLDAGAGALVAEWLAARERFLGSRGAGGAPLICSSSGNAVTTGYIRRLMKRLGRAAGIEKRVHAHGLRHTHASELRAEGVDIAIISRQLGHRSLMTTIRYLDHIAPWSVVEAVRGREWERL